MKILILSPLYPPDIAVPAPYIKELATRLKEKHQVTILTYGNIPEDIQDVEIIAIDKRFPLRTRLTKFHKKLQELSKDIDVLYTENGASVELPALFVHKPIIFHIGDPKAFEQANRNILHKLLHNFLRSKARTVFAESPLAKPEILPFGEVSESKKAEYESSWKEHLSEIEKHLNHE